MEATNLEQPTCEVCTARLWMFIPAECADCMGDVHSRSRSSGTSELARGEIHISPWGEVYISSPSPEHLSAQGRASTVQVYMN
jgi:hypothetical protein